LGFGSKFGAEPKLGFLFFAPSKLLSTLKEARMEQKNMLSLGMVLNSQSSPSSTFFLFVPSELFSVWRSLDGAKKEPNSFFCSYKASFDAKRSSRS
jgi:hypothetical protein